jgi:hypothetical protein
MKNKLITCIAPAFNIDIIKKLESKNIFTANVHMSRGASVNSNVMDKLVGVLSVIVSENMSDEIFEFLYNELKMFEKSNGLMYQQTLNNSSKYASRSNIRCKSS